MALDGVAQSPEVSRPLTEAEGVVEVERGRVEEVMETLTEDERETVRAFAWDFLEQEYEEFDTDMLQSPFRKGIKLMDDLAEMVGCDPMYYSSKYRQTAALFLEEMIQFIEVKSKINEEEDRFNQFVGHLDQLIFGYSDSLAFIANQAARFSLMARATRTPLLNGWMKQRFFVEFVEDPWFTSGGGALEIANSLRKVSVGKKLDALHLLGQIHRGVYRYEDDKYIQVARACHTIADILAKNDSSAFLQYAKMAAFDTTNNIMLEAPTQKVSLDYTGQYDRYGLLQEMAPIGSQNDKGYNQLAQVTAEVSFNPFKNIDTEDIPLLLQQIHHPRMRDVVENDLGVELKEMTLGTQIQLLQFMAEEPPETFEKLRAALPGEGVEREHFLTAFLACAKDREYGYKILELAGEHPEESRVIFERFYQIISVTQQEEQKLKTALEGNPELKQKANLIHLYQTVINRGAELLSDAYENIDTIDDIEAYLQEAKRYQLKLVAFRGIFDSITAGDRSVSPQEIEQLSADQIKVETKKGGALNLSEADKQMVINNIRKTYKGIDEGWAEHLIKQLPENFNNPNSSFILIRNEEGDLVAIGRADKVDDNEYYMGTFYVEDGYQGVGRYVGQYLQQDIPKGALIKGTTAPANLATMWHIEINGYVGREVVHQGQSKALIECDNHPGITFITQDKNLYSQSKIRAMGPGEHESGAIKIIHVDTSPAANDQMYSEDLENFFKQGYRLTRFFYDKDKNEKPNTWMVLEKVS